ncbi:MAG: PhoU domain-containing protein [Pseudomonadota bacterium]
MKTRDAALAQEVIARDKRLDALEFELDELATRIIALRQPMAQDLRLLISALRMATTLERVGDLSKNIARRAVYLASVRPVRLSSSIVRMGQQTLVSSRRYWMPSPPAIPRSPWRSGGGMWRSTRSTTRSSGRSSPT